MSTKQILLAAAGFALAASARDFPVADFGALGDGTNDDTAAIVAAIGACARKPAISPAGTSSAAYR